MTDTTTNSPDVPARGGLDADWRSALRAPLVLALAALLAMQIALAVLLGGDRVMAPAAPDVPLLELDPGAVTELQIESGDGESLVIARRGDGWVLPAVNDFPASGTRIDTLLEELAGLDRPLPVATSADARRRFKVADEAFERRLTLRGDGGEATLIVGDSPGFRRLFARVGGEDVVYDIRLGLFDLSADADDWIDRGRLQFDRGEITRITAEDADGDWVLVRGEEGWSLAGTDAAVDTAAADDLANAVATVGYTGVLGPDADADYDLDEPSRVLTIEHDGQVRRYLLAPIADSADYALRRDGEPHVYRLGAFDAETLVDTGRARLLGQEASAAALEPSGDDDGSAGEETAAPEVQPGGEAAGAAAEAGAATGPAQAGTAASEPHGGAAETGDQGQSVAPEPERDPSAPPAGAAAVRAGSAPAPGTSSAAEAPGPQ
jgi:hypothetical protein